MTRATYETFCAALIASILCAAPIACDSPSSTTEVAPAPVTAPQLELETPTRVEAPPVSAHVAPPIDAQPVLASATTPSIELPIEHAGAPALEPKQHAADSLRSASLLPPGTPDANIAAFTNLALGKSDKPLIAGVGASGIHLDELEVGKGWASSRCDDLGHTFVAGVDERVNVCLRVVHPRAEETITLEWARDGKLRHSIDLHVKPTHAYLTRAWMPVSSGRAGEWTATVKSEDGSVLGQLSFEIGG